MPVFGTSQNSRPTSSTHVGASDGHRVGLSFHADAGKAAETWGTLNVPSSELNARPAVLSQKGILHRS